MGKWVVTRGSSAPFGRKRVRHPERHFWGCAHDVRGSVLATLRFGGKAVASLPQSKMGGLSREIVPAGSASGVDSDAQP